MDNPPKARIVQAGETPALPGTPRESPIRRLKVADNASWPRPLKAASD